MSLDSIHIHNTFFEALVNNGEAINMYVDVDLYAFEFASMCAIHTKMPVCVSVFLCLCDSVCVRVRPPAHGS